MNKADLAGVKLRNADLSSVNLQAANLQAVNLSEANLGNSKLQAANLQAAFLIGTNPIWFGASYGNGHSHEGERSSPCRGTVGNSKLLDYSIYFVQV